MSPIFAVVSIGSIFGVVHPHLLSFDVDNAEAQPSQAATIQAVALDHLLTGINKAVRQSTLINNCILPY